MGGGYSKWLVGGNIQKIRKFILVVFFLITTLSHSFYVNYDDKQNAVNRPKFRYVRVWRCQSILHNYSFR